MESFRCKYLEKYPCESCWRPIGPDCMNLNRQDACQGVGQIYLVKKNHHDTNSLSGSLEPDREFEEYRYRTVSSRIL